MSNAEVVALCQTLFAAISALDGTEAQFQHAIDGSEATGRDNKNEIERVVSTLLHAARVARAACEVALTRMEPMYDDDLCTTANYTVCVNVVQEALANANTVNFALLAYASMRLAGSLPSQEVLCENEAMHNAILFEMVGAVALGVVMLEFGVFSVSAPKKIPRGLFHHTLQQKQPNMTILHILLSSPTLTVTATETDCTTTALGIASYRGHTEAIGALITCPEVAASAGAVNPMGYTPLMFAATNGHTTTVAALLACPAVCVSAAAVNAGGDSALVLAATGGHAATVTALLGCPVVSASAGAPNQHGWTVLMLCAATCVYHPTIIAAVFSALLACPTVLATANRMNRRGHTALDIARAHKNSIAVISLGERTPERTPATTKLFSFVTSFTKMFRQ
jgi:Ankyrin repeats (3 copies)